MPTPRPTTGNLPVRRRTCRSRGFATKTLLGPNATLSTPPPQDDEAAVRPLLPPASACLALLLLSTATPALAQSHDAFTPTHADSVRGSDNPSRAWWDVTFYDLHVRVSPADSS